MFWVKHRLTGSLETSQLIRLDERFNSQVAHSIKLDSLGPRSDRLDQPIPSSFKNNAKVTFILYNTLQKALLKVTFFQYPNTKRVFVFLIFY